MLYGFDSESLKCLQCWNEYAECVCFEEDNPDRPKVRQQSETVAFAKASGLGCGADHDAAVRGAERFVSVHAEAENVDGEVWVAVRRGFPVQP